MSYPWIKDSKYGLTPSVTNYLEVTSPNGLYLNSGNDNLTISNSSIQQVSLDFNTLITNGTLQTSELATNITSNFTPTEIHIGATGETNVGTLYCRNIECGENLNVVTINGLPPVGPTGATGPSGANGISSGLILFLDNPTNTTSVPVTSTLLLVPNQTAQTIIDYTFINTNNPVLMGSFLTNPNILQSGVIVGGLWEFSGYFSTNTTTNPVVYAFVNLYIVDSSGNIVDTLYTGNYLNGVVVNTPTTNFTLFTIQFYVNTYTITNLSHRIKLEVYVQSPTGNPNTKHVKFSFRQNTPSHLHTTLLTNVTGPTGPTGATGPAGQPIYIKYAEIDSTNPNLYPSGTITFPSGVTFLSAPIVIATTNKSSIGITVTSTTVNNFQYTFTGPSTGLIKINYIASS
jgi:hypothetical protein